MGWIRVIVFKVTFNNISVISWRSPSFIGGGNRGNRKKPALPQVTDKLYNSPSLVLLLRVCFVDRCLSFFVRLLLSIVLSVLLITPRGVATVRYFRHVPTHNFPPKFFY